MPSTYAFEGGWFRAPRRSSSWAADDGQIGRRRHHGRAGRRFEEPPRGEPFGFGGALGPFGPFGPGRGRRGGGRARRGDVRAAALVLLAEEPRNGYQIIQELANRSE